MICNNRFLFFIRYFKGNLRHLDPTPHNALGCDRSSIEIPQKAFANRCSKFIGKMGSWENGVRRHFSTASMAYPRRLRPNDKRVFLPCSAFCVGTILKSRMFRGWLVGYRGFRPVAQPPATILDPFGGFRFGKPPALRGGKEYLDLMAALGCRIQVHRAVFCGRWPELPGLLQCAHT
jgi:hypothetical protein